MDVPFHADLLLLVSAVEGFFSKLTRHGAFFRWSTSIVDLESAITRYIAATNRNPKKQPPKIIQAQSDPYNSV